MLAAGSRQAGNVVDSLEYVPGTAVWGALATAFVIDKGGRLRGTDRQRFDELFHGQGLRFGNLYPCHLEAGDRLFPSLPIPRSALTCRSSPGFQLDEAPSAGNEDLSHGVADSLLLGVSRHGKCERCDGRCEPLDGFYCVTKKRQEAYPGREAGVRSVVPRMRSTMHNKIEDTTGLTERGNLFGLTSLESGQYLSGMISVPEAANIDGVWPEEQWFPIVLGKGKSKQGTAVAHIEEVAAEVALRDLWDQTLKDRLSNIQELSFTLTLISDAIVMDNWLLFHVGISPLLAEWSRLCGAKEIEQVKAFTGYRRFSGWSGIDRRPRGEQAALIKGSCFHLKVVGADPNKLANLLTNVETEGIGFRRNEGFGSVLINDSFHRLVQELVV